jgi:PTH1 family peptidyl-tRNA hydrolase
MHLIVGLGNPGAEYARTRHNIGWMVLDELARRHALAFDKKQSHAKVAAGFFGPNKILLAKPQTYMNLSGKSVAGLMNFYRVERSQVLVICDDLNLPPGKLRLRANGSDGGQNGLKSVAQMIGSRDYARLRFGIGTPPEEERRERGTAAYVLRPFLAEEASLIEAQISRACDCVETFVSQGVETAMNQFNVAEKTGS